MFNTSHHNTMVARRRSPSALIPSHHLLLAILYLILCRSRSSGVLKTHHFVYSVPFNFRLSTTSACVRECTAQHEITYYRYHKSLHRCWEDGQKDGTLVAKIYILIQLSSNELRSHLGEIHDVWCAAPASKPAPRVNRAFIFFLYWLTVHLQFRWYRV